ncbi:hypothetical protein SmJEL517_g02390 [Synchytrium microbalum]|uniref:DH domain-containing protein n=1 Tax=Synchytrium microbalum TaxID=1806994 RepID=A0A507C0J0_9FUNG|nr:uncharacterized protein SmJEL517_g02390 [Synchytrium microbalum]TPX35050.1 hypothetical protein SmJEL517_g02390 [Synchytrium microbalum]
MSSLPQTTKIVTSLSQNCANIVTLLFSLGGNWEQYLFPEGELISKTPNPTPIDPISTLFDSLRLGAPLCELYNRLGLSELEVVDVADIPKGAANQHRCKQATFKFLVALKDELGLPDEQRFEIRDLYNDDTNGHVKVLKTINIILDQLSSMGLMPIRKSLPIPFAVPSDQPPRDKVSNRDMTIAELLSTERSYVASLEELQAYQNTVYQRKLVSTEVGRSIFANLNELIDFQRRFLSALESALARSNNEQRIGAVFIDHEDGFKVYGPYCVNYIDVNLILPSHFGSLQPLASVIEPTRGLPSYLIRPVQRLAKYPLLLRQLILLSQDTNYPYTDELKKAEECTLRIADMINEAKRREENRRLKIRLATAVEDWKGLEIMEMGDLQLADRFLMEAHDIEREYHLFLFDKILLCCKEVPNNKKKVPAKKQRASQTDAVERFTLKGNIYIHSIAEVQDTSKKPSYFGLKIYWRDGPDLESFSIKCLNVEQCKMWKAKADALVDEAKVRRKSLAERNAYASGTQLNHNIIKLPNGSSPAGRRPALLVEPDDDDVNSDVGSQVSSQGSLMLPQGAYSSPDRPPTRSMSSPAPARNSGGVPTSPGPPHLQRKFSNVDGRITLPPPPPSAPPPMPSSPARPRAATTGTGYAPSNFSLTGNGPPSPTRYTQQQPVAVSGQYSPTRSSLSSSASNSNEDLGARYSQLSNGSSNPPQLVRRNTGPLLDVDSGYADDSDGSVGMGRLRKQSGSDESLRGHLRGLSGDASAYYNQPPIQQQMQQMMPQQGQYYPPASGPGMYGYRPTSNGYNESQGDDSGYSSRSSSSSSFASVRARTASGNAILMSAPNNNGAPPLPVPAFPYLPSPPTTPSAHRYPPASKSSEELRRDREQPQRRELGNTQLPPLPPIPALGTASIDGYFGSHDGLITGSNSKGPTIISPPARSASAVASSLRQSQPPPARKSSNDYSNEVVPPLVSAAPVTRTSTSPLPPGGVRVRFHLGPDSFLIGISGPDFALTDLIAKIDKKLRAVGRGGLYDGARLRYKDEDGDYITMRSDEDFGMAVEVARLIQIMHGASSRAVEQAVVDVYVQ